MAWSWVSSTILSLLPQSYLGLFLSSLALSLLVFLAHHYQQSRARRKPGIPTDYPLLGMFPSLISNAHRFHEWEATCVREAGGNFFFHGSWFSNNDFLATADPANVRHVFTTNFTDYPKGKELDEAFDILGNGIFSADGESWRGQRLKAQLVMTTPKWRSFVASYSRDKMKRSLLPFLSHAARNGSVIDLHDACLRLTFDLTTKLVFGEDPGCLSISLPSVPFARAIDDAMETLFFRLTVPALVWKLMRRLRIGQEKKMAKAWAVIDDFIAQSVAKRRRLIRTQARKDDGDESVALLSNYIDEHHGEGDSKVDSFLRDTAVNFMLAGRDTTGSGMAWFFWLLSEHPRVEEKILQELESVRPAGRTPEGWALFDSVDLEKLVYLHAALCEALRLYPPVPYEHKAAAKEDVLPSGFRVGPGTKIRVSMYGMGRMEGVWGEDCREYRPERWLTEKGKLRYEPSYKFVAFNTGPRTCLGKETAFTQLKAAVSALLCNFRVEVVKGQAIVPKLSIILQMKNGLMVRVSKREGSPTN